MSLKSKRQKELHCSKVSLLSMPRKRRIGHMNGLFNFQNLEEFAERENQHPSLDHHTKPFTSPRHWPPLAFVASCCFSLLSTCFFICTALFLKSVNVIAELSLSIMSELPSQIHEDIGLMLLWYLQLTCVERACGFSRPCSLESALSVAVMANCEVCWLTFPVVRMVE